MINSPTLSTMSANQNLIAKLGSLLALAFLALTTAARAQNYELPPEVRILTYTNSSYSDAPGYQDWAYPEGNRHGGGYTRSHNITAYSRDNGGQITNFYGWNSYESGYGGGTWNVYNESRDSTLWFGPCPATAQVYSYYTNSWWWEGMEMPSTDWNASLDYTTNYVWEPYESRQALNISFQPTWTLEFDWGLPHLGCYYKRTNYTQVDTTLELLSGGYTNATDDVTMQLNVWAFDNLRGRWLTWDEITVTVGTPPGVDDSWLRAFTGGAAALNLTPDTNNNVYFLSQDNQRLQVRFSFHPTNALPTNAVTGSYDYSFWAWPARHYVLVGVDKNRDGSIDLDGTNDLTSAAAPHAFWINDDRDEYDSSISDYVDANGASTYSSNLIVNHRDLEDFERLAIRFPSFAYYDPTALWSLRVTAPAPLKFFAGTSDSRAHVSSPDTAAQLTDPTQRPGTCMGEANSTLTLPGWAVNEALQNFATIYCLFEAGSAGTGALQVELLRNGDVVGRAKVYLKLRPLTEMYDHFTAGDTTATGVIPASTAQQIGTCQLTGLDDDYILFVHGWRMQEWERRRFAETAFKRLWWQGYKGRFGLFSWPTEWVSSWQVWPTPIPPYMLLDMGNFNRSEQQAWKSGTALGKLLAYNLNAGQHAGKVRVFAHSMGNVVVGEALRQLAVGGWTNVVQTYVSCQGALASHAYDPQATVRMLTRKNPSVPGGELFYVDDGTRNLYSEYPVAPGSPYFTVAGMGGVANFVNYRNHRDFALGNWEYNQSVKPDSGYQWSAGNDFFIGSKVLAYYANGNPYYQDVVTTNLLPIPDHFEIFAHAAEARCYATGAQPWLAGPFSGEVDLNAPPYSFDDPSSHHSAQFNSSIQVRWSFWQKLLDDFFP